MNIALAADHAGIRLKTTIKEHLLSRGYTVTDLGTDSDESCDYPIFARAVGKEITEKRAELGILVCGTGIGMSITANKIRGIRAAVCSDMFSAKYTRLHNDANVLCLGARVLGDGLALELVNVFLNTAFEGGKHCKRISMIE